MKILVTGGAGFVGSCLSEQLLNRGNEVVALDNFNDYYSPERKRKNIEPLLDNDKFTLIEGDFRDQVVLNDLFNKFAPEAIAHMGAMANVRHSVKHPHLFNDVNVIGTGNLLELAAKTNVNNFVFASTSSIYGQRKEVPFIETDRTDGPLAPYPATKKMGELLGHAYQNMHGLNFTALRFFNVYGPKGRPDMMPYKVFELLTNNEEITLFDAGELSRDWTYIDDVVSGVISAIEKPHPYEIINIGRGEPFPMTEFINIAESIAGIKANIRNAPAPLSEPKITYANVDKAKKLYGYNPQTSLQVGLSNLWEWFQAEVLNN
ncbi:MAG: NAD-dependent epimerase/dehydratase family protein [Bdellovibrionales bacterium]|nr:NAD-dependent epimerase/dehydratase family protein [Bdellovibrionales bacterium]